MRRCSVSDCQGRHKGRGLCSRHYQRLLKHGSVEPPPSPSERLDTPEKVWVKLLEHSVPVGECLLWQRPLMSGGYGLLTIQRRPTLTHRAAYEARVGAIPEGMHVHHTCFNRSCIEPTHLRVVTPAQNGQARQGAQPGTKSGIRGVKWIKGSERWMAFAQLDNKVHYGGTFDTEVEAGNAARLLRKELGFYGE